MIVLHHNKDLDGFASGAICKYKYPEAKLIGWDYKDEIPDFEQFRDEDVIMIDITFPINKIEELLGIVNSLTIIDHHISFFKGFKEHFYPSDNGNIAESYTFFNMSFREGKLKLIYKAGIAACEIAWKYFFNYEEPPIGITLLGRYDTWRKDEGDWFNETLPFQYAMKIECTSAETFPTELFTVQDMDYIYNKYISVGNSVLKYQSSINTNLIKNYAFERNFKGYRTICVNQAMGSSLTFDSIWDEEKYDLMMVFSYDGKKYTFSIYTTKNDIDCSILAKEMGGGGHKQASGFSTTSLESVFTNSPEYVYHFKANNV